MSSEVSTKEAFFVCATVLLGLIVLVALRILVAVLMEIICFDRYADRRNDCLRLICPCYRRRTSPMTRPVDSTTTDGLPSFIPISSLVGLYDNHSNNGRSNTGPPDGFNDICDDALDGLTQEQRCDVLGRCGSITVLLNRILPGKIFSDADVLELRKKVQSTLKDVSIKPAAGDDCSSSLEENQINHLKVDADGEPSNVCSICIHEINVGDSVYVAKQCDHAFHSECIQLWVGKPSLKSLTTNQILQHDRININNHCPNCRTAIFLHANDILSLLRN